MTSSARARTNCGIVRPSSRAVLRLDDEIEPHRLLDGQVAGVGPLQKPIDIVRRPTEVVRSIRPVSHQAAVFDIFALGVDGGQARRIDECDDVPTVVPEHPVSEHNHPADTGKDSAAEREQVLDASRHDRGESHLAYRSHGLRGRLEIRR